MIYQKTLKKICRLPKVTEEQIHAIFLKQENTTVKVAPINLGKPGFEITTNEGTCFVTERSIDYYNKRWGRVTALQEKMIELAIPVPLYIGEGTISKEIHEINQSKNPLKGSDQWLHRNFSIEIAITYFQRYFSASNSFKEYKTIIFEAIEAYYMGMDHVAIMSLIPVFEAGLRNIQNSVLGMSSQNVSSQEFEKGLKELCLNWGRRRTNQYIWHPGKGYNTAVEIDFFTHICPQADVINAFRMFFSHVLYKSNRQGVVGLNRHIIIHMLKNEFNNPANFPRIFLALTHITFIESLSNQNVPFFWPGYNDDGEVKALAIYIRKISESVGEPRRKLLNNVGISNYGYSV
ncbi:hypothetical protein NFG57_04615 [Halomonas sp. H10-59]|uniref:Uncharacterized protein n=1 Tax=Halomonas sp. H10-59 TaxID=2950874 RepID=A0AAU7KX21_9GAMM